MAQGCPTTERAAGWHVRGRDRSPKSARPTRTSVLPSSMATS